VTHRQRMENFSLCLKKKKGDLRRINKAHQKASADCPPSTLMLKGFIELGGGETE